MSLTADFQFRSARKHSRFSLKPSLWMAFLLFTSFNGLMAIQYFFAVLNGSVPCWIQMQAWLVSDAFSLGRNSVHQAQHAVYTANTVALLVHTTAGGVCLAAGAFQFSKRLQARYTAIHRMVGRIYVIATGLSMAGGLAYLSSVPLREVYSGVHFGIGLWALDLLVILTAVLAYVTVRRRDIRAHRAWATFNYSLIIVTPLLRLLWIVLGNALPSFTQAEINAGVATFLLPVALVSGMIWLTFQQLRSRPATVAFGSRRRHRFHTSIHSH